MQEDEMREGGQQDGFGQYEDLRDDSVMRQFEETPVVTSTPQVSKKKSAKEWFGIIFLAVMAIGIIVWCLWSGLRGLFFAPVHEMDEVFSSAVKGEVYEGSILYASKEYGSLEHTINLIPAGTEYFYIMYAPTLNEAILIRAPKGWDSGFSSDLLNPLSLQARGMVRELDYEMKKELSETAAAFGEEGVHFESTLYLDIMVNQICIMQLFVGIIFPLSILYFRYLLKANGDVETGMAFKQPLAVTVSLLFFASMLMLIYLLNMT